MSSSHYDSVLRKDKDNLGDKYELRRRNDDHKKKSELQRTTMKISTTPKRRIDDLDKDSYETDEEHFTVTEKRRSKKTRPISSLDDRRSENQTDIQSPQRDYQGHKQKGRKNMSERGMVIYNSRTSNGRRTTQSKKEDENIQEMEERATTNTPQLNHESRVHHDNTINISQQALRYAVSSQLPPFKLLYQPQVKDQLKGTKLIKSLFVTIQEGFKTLNKSYTRPLGFDTWYVDKQGALICYTQEIELFVYLWDTSHFPEKLSNTTITPIVLTHLPPQYSIIMKYIPRNISNEEVMEALTNICHSKILLEDMRRSISNKSRHIRIDLTLKEEIMKILDGGVFPMNGQLIEVSEFLAPPQLLICSRCNAPGHIKKECKSLFDRCRRCGSNKLEGEHQECQIKCHHCDGDHLATDYRCPVMMKFRGELIDELRKRPDLLPHGTQLFIPIQFRKGGKGIINSSQRAQNIPSRPPNINCTTAWPTINGAMNTKELAPMDATRERLARELEASRDGYEKAKLDFNQREQQLILKQRNFKAKLNSTLNLLVAQNSQQNDCIEKVYTAINETIPVITNSLKAMCVFMEEIVNLTGNMNLEKEFNGSRMIIDQNLAMLNDRNELMIDFQRATSKLNGRTSELFQQSIEFLSTDEQ